MRWSTQVRKLIFAYRVTDSTKKKKNKYEYSTRQKSKSVTDYYSTINQVELLTEHSTQ